MVDDKELKQIRIQAYADGKTIFVPSQIYSQIADLTVKLEKEQHGIDGLKEDIEKRKDEIAKLEARVLGYHQALESRRKR